MAAPFKSGLDYFTCDCFFDDKTELVIAEFGLKGLGVLVRLWQKIYSTEGYYCLWNEDVALMFGSKNNVSVSAVSEIISACVRRGVFDRGMLERCGILTSRGIQKRYFEAVKRRSTKSVIGDYLLIDVPAGCVVADNNAVNTDSNGKNADSNAQSKGNESKGNQRERKKAYGKYRNVYLTDTEYRTLLAQHPRTAEEYIARLSDYLHNRKDKQYADHAYTISKWIAEDEAKAQSGKGKLQRKPSFDIDELKRRAEMEDDYDV